jgi:methionine sulfoxide reductase heme-binding subunit
VNVDARYRWLWKPAAHVAAGLPLALMVLAAAGLAGALPWTDLGADPARELIHRCGKTALNLLLVTLAVTPARRLLHWPEVQRLRRLLGLWAFTYALLHFVVYVVLDQQFDLGAIVEDIVKRPYITIGMLALLALVPLAVTSTHGWMRRLKKRWQTLHRLIYPIAILGVWHYWWQVKRDVREPLVYASILALLLGYRLAVGPVARRIRARSAPARAPGTT